MVTKTEDGIQKPVTSGLLAYPWTPELEQGKRHETTVSVTLRPRRDENEIFRNGGKKV